MKMGAKYREPVTQPWSCIRTSVVDSASNFVNKMCTKFKLSVNSLNAWFSRVVKVLDNRMKYFRSQGLLSLAQSKPVLNKSSVRKDIQDLHDSYIIVPADKAANNFVVCKMFYVEFLLRELGINTVTFTHRGNSTYVPCHKSLQDIIFEHQEVFIDSFGIKCREVNLCIPQLFWIPKLHKNPYKYRFIEDARQCSTKQLSVIVNSGFQVVREQFRKYCSAIEKNSGVNTFWSINSSLEF